MMIRAPASSCVSRLAASAVVSPVSYTHLDVYKRQVMDKVGLPRGLIRYTTENALAKHFTSKDVVGHILRPRIILYLSLIHI